MSTKYMRSLLSGVGLFSLILSTSAHAESVSLNINVLEKYEGFVQFQLKAENISLESIHDVVIETNGDNVPRLNYGDIEAGMSAVQIVSLDWDPLDEPPSLNWTITYLDVNGNSHSQTN